MTSLTTAAECSRRSDDHYRAAVAVAGIDDADGREWAAVAFFYAAYHCVRAAILDDPIFGNATMLSRVSPKLTMADRSATHHQGRRSADGHRLGISEIVPLLYPVIRSEYAALASAAIDVRYGSKLLPTIDDLQARCDRIREQFAIGALVGAVA